MTTYNTQLNKTQLTKKIMEFEAAVRKIRDTRGDDKCWKDYEALFALLPEGYIPPKRDEFVELELCKEYIRSCHNPNVAYVSPQRRIEELEKQIGDMYCIASAAYEHANDEGCREALLRITKVFHKEGT